MIPSIGYPGEPVKENLEVEFSRSALVQRHLLMQSGGKATGFILGNQLGKYAIIENFMAFRFNRRTLNQFYPVFFRQFGERLLGVFFLNCGYFLNDWFLEDILIRLSGQEYSAFRYRLEPDGRELTPDCFPAQEGING